MLFNQKLPVNAYEYRWSYDKMAKNLLGRTDMDFLVERGNIVYCDTDAIVLPANSMLREGSGASRAIFTAAGKAELKKACAGVKTPVEVGMAVPTAGYNLEASFIIHAVVPKWVDGKHDEYELLSSAYRSSLEVSDRMKCKSIAFPLLASGNNGFDRELAFRIAAESIKAFEPSYLETVKLIVFDAEMAVFVQSLGYDVINRFTPSAKEKAAKAAKGIAKDFVKDAIKMGMDFINDEDNRKMIINAGVSIVCAIIGGIAKKDVIAKK